MFRSPKFHATTLVSMLTLALAGCGGQSAAPVADAGHDEHAHDHEHSAGPHGGDILELGEYHGELVHNHDDGSVTVYILDGAATSNVPVDAKEAVINITREGLAKQFTLAASPEQGEPSGWSSRFVSSEAELATELDGEGTAAVFSVEINGEPHRAMVEHKHDHDHDHDHAHGDADHGHDDHAGEDHTAEAHGAEADHDHDHAGETAEEHAEHAHEAAEEAAK
jgi:hypothetical protein